MASPSHSTTSKSGSQSTFSGSVPNSTDSSKVKEPIQTITQTQLDLMDKNYKLGLAKQAVLMEDLARNLQLNRDRQEARDKTYGDFARTEGDRISKKNGGEGMSTEEPETPTRDDDMRVNIDSPVTTTVNHHYPSDSQTQPDSAPKDPANTGPANPSAPEQSFWDKYGLPLALLATAGGLTVGGLSAWGLSSGGGDPGPDTNTQYRLELYENGEETN